MSKLADRLWERMSEMYGTAWVNKFGPIPTQAWIEVLESVDRLAIKHGLQECAKNNTFPPNLPEFVVYLRDYARQARQMDESAPALPRIMSDEERKKAREIIAVASRGLKPGGQRRNLLRPGETLTDYQDAMSDSGISAAEFRKKRLAENGWTQADEIGFLRQLSGINQSMKYGPDETEDFTK